MGPPQRQSQQQLQPLNFRKSSSCIPLASQVISQTNAFQPISMSTSNSTSQQSNHSGRSVRVETTLSGQKRKSENSSQDDFDIKKNDGILDLDKRLSIKEKEIAALKKQIQLLKAKQLQPTAQNRNEAIRYNLIDELHLIKALNDQKAFEIKRGKGASVIIHELECYASQENLEQSNQKTIQAMFRMLGGIKSGCKNRPSLKNPIVQRTILPMLKLDSLLEKQTIMEIYDYLILLARETKVSKEALEAGLVEIVLKSLKTRLEVGELDFIRDIKCVELLCYLIPIFEVPLNMLPPPCTLITAFPNHEWVLAIGQLYLTAFYGPAHSNGNAIQYPWPDAKAFLKKLVELHDELPPLIHLAQMVEKMMAVAVPEPMVLS